VKASISVLFAAALTVAGPAFGQAYPNKPIRLVVPFAPGGGSDAIARPLIEKLSSVLGQNVIIENRGGANGNIGAEVVAQATADGYTLLFANASLPISASLYKKLAFDVLKDFTPVSLVSVSPSVLVVNPGVPAASVQELVALAKSQPGKLNYATAGAGSTMHLAAELFNSMAGVQMVHVPFKGAGPAISDVMAGHVQLLFVNIPPVAGQIKAGTLRPLAVTTPKRSSALPDVPTLDESGLKGYDSTTWYGLMGPAGLPPEIVERLNKAIAETVRTPAIQERLRAVGSEPETNSPQEFREFLKDNIESWAKVVKASGASAD
jgi:tripartite-type tricarboxylate transporter receptor subunit TctC